MVEPSQPAWAKAVKTVSVEGAVPVVWEALLGVGVGRESHECLG